MKRKLSVVLTSAVLLSSIIANAQQTTTSRTRVITSAVPFLTISPDARAAALGDAGVASSPDANSIYWNAAKLAFVNKNVGASISYVPWLRELIDDMFIANVSGFKKAAKNQAFGFAMTYFNPGKIEFTTQQGQTAGDFQSREFSMTGAYSRKLSRDFSMGINLRYIHSNLIGDYVVNQQASKAANQVSGDISAYYVKNSVNRERGTDYSFGAVISNIGGKISYGREAYFLPTNLKIGTNIARRLDAHNRFNFLIDFNKLLVPTPDPSDPLKYANTGVINGIFSSFGGAPVGDKLREITSSVGLEYWYNDLFAARGGYFFEASSKGGRRYVTAGLGVKLKDSYGIDLAYLIPTTTGSPLANTWRISLIFDLDKRQVDSPTEADVQ
ncbi:MAG: type IX secretion system outer membrane channel protein PorV [Spirosomaceae bacterium]|nr:type IX secretion system outer membrane channel protein PorV [Spirosomataceae bacterium]